MKLLFRRPVAAVLIAGIVGAGLTACGGSDDHSGMDHEAASPSVSHATSAAAPGSGHEGHGGGEQPAGDGLAASAEGFTFTPVSAELPAAAATDYKFKIVDTAGAPVTSYEVEQTKKLHFYLIRSDLSGFQHVHPTLEADGTWTARLAAVQPGDHRVYASFIARNGSGEAKPVVLGQPVKVPGTPATTRLPAVSDKTSVDGYGLSVLHEPMSGMAHPLMVKFTKGGKPVTDLQPYLDTYAHITAFQADTLALTHLHPEGVAKGKGGPELEFEATFTNSADYRLFIQFQTGGRLHTAAITLRAG